MCCAFNRRNTNRRTRDKVTNIRNNPWLQPQFVLYVVALPQYCQFPRAKIAIIEPQIYQATTGLKLPPGLQPHWECGCLAKMRAQVKCSFKGHDMTLKMHPHFVSLPYLWLVFLIDGQDAPTFLSILPTVTPFVPMQPEMKYLLIKLQKVVQPKLNSRKKLATQTHFTY